MKHYFLFYRLCSIYESLRHVYSIFEQFSFTTDIFFLIEIRRFKLYFITLYVFAWLMSLLWAWFFFTNVVDRYWATAPLSLDLFTHDPAKCLESTAMEKNCCLFLSLSGYWVFYPHRVARSSFWQFPINDLLCRKVSLHNILMLFSGTV